MNKPQALMHQLYGFLLKDTEGCFDVFVNLDSKSNIIHYQDQGGIIKVDFKNNLIIREGGMADTFGYGSKQELASENVDSHTKELSFYTSYYGTKSAKLVQEYLDEEEFIKEVKELPIFEGARYEKEI